MEVIQTIKQMREAASKVRAAGKSIAFVPTMGAFHGGHIRLMQKAKTLGDITVVSSFVNPKQFNEKEDLNRYPRDPERDRLKAEKAGVDYYFEPAVEEIYPPGFLTTVNVSYLSSKLEGASRPGHFRGVTTVVLKFLNIVSPNTLVMGYKDAQQFTIIHQMIEDLALDVHLVGVPTARERDGLAMSSRNVLLSPEDRDKALSLNRALKRVHFLVKKQGILHTGELLQAVRSAINSSGAELDYAEIVNRTTLEPVDHVMRGGTYVLVAARVGGVRLIDSTRI
ncbi:MAG: pantoate--beta-alanine ligase [Candidatus Sumerlaeia bacterium]|nr:pantoate--beta-alanine ligase [Candidatus Sumerlaeia bacterium]